MPELRPPVSLEIGGTEFEFEPGLTEVHAYRYAVDQPYNHIEAIQTKNGLDRRRIYIFDCLDACMFLAGQPLEGHTMGKKELKAFTSAMDENFGWESDFIVKDSAPDEIKERYIRIATIALKKEVLVIPKSWK
jgi:hypothetical protein